MKLLDTHPANSVSKPQSGAVYALKATILAAFAAIGVQVTVTEAQGAITITGMPNSSVSERSFATNSGIIETNPLDPSVSSNSYLQLTTPPIGNEVQGTTGFTVTLDAADIGDGVTIRLEWDGGVSTSPTYTPISNESNGGISYWYAPYYVQQLTQWHKQGETPTVGATIASLGEFDEYGQPVPRINDVNDPLTGSEEILLQKHFSIDIDVTSAGIYDLKYIFGAYNTTGAAKVENLTISGRPIPDSTTITLSALGAAGLLLRRRREGSKDTTQV